MLTFDKRRGLEFGSRVRMYDYLLLHRLDGSCLIQKRFVRTSRNKRNPVGCLHFVHWWTTSIYWVKEWSVRVLYFAKIVGWRHSILKHGWSRCLLTVGPATTVGNVFLRDAPCSHSTYSVKHIEQRGLYGDFCSTGEGVPRQVAGRVPFGPYNSGKSFHWDLSNPTHRIPLHRRLFTSVGTPPPKPKVHFSLLSISGTIQ